MDLATVGLRIDGKQGIRTLNQFTGSAHNAGLATEKFERTTKNLSKSVNVGAVKMRGAAQSAKLVNKEAAAATAQVKRLGAAFLTLGGFLGLRQLVEYADTWKLINARINLVTKSQEQSMAVQQRLFQIAQKTRNTLSATAVLYTRVALNADQLGRSHEELLGMVSAVNSAMLISGATGVEAAQGMRQLAQALGSGRLQGDEFRTVMEAMPVVARAIADEMGVPLGQLKELSAAGKVSVQVIIDALLNAQEELERIAALMPMTIGQSFQVFQNSLTRVIGIMNEGTGVGMMLSDSIKFIADHMNQLIAAVSAATFAFVAYKLAMVGAWVYTQLMIAARTIQMWWQLVRAVRSLADMMYLVNTAAKGLASTIAILAALTVGVIAYRAILANINEETEKWINAQGDLNEVLGTRQEPPDTSRLKTEQRIEDMIREAHQAVVLAGLQEAAQARMEIRFDAVNKRIEARRELTGQLRQAMLGAIDVEEKLALKALATAEAMDGLAAALKKQEAVLKRFASNFQREIGNVFFKIFDEGIETFGDLFDGIKKMFYRMIADMAAAQLMRKVGGTLSAIVAGVLGSSPEVAAAQEIAKKAAVEASGHLGPALGPDGTVPVTIEGITVTASKSWAVELGKYLGPLLAGFAIGQMVGGLTTNRALGTAGGALAGAGAGAAIGSVVPGVGTLVGGIVGGIAGAVGGFLGASKAAKEESERLRDALENLAKLLAMNNFKLNELRAAFSGRIHQELLAVRDTPQMLVNMDLLGRVAGQLGIRIFDEEGHIIEAAYHQLIEAVNLTIQAMTQWGNSLEEEVRAQQSAYNKIFDVEESSQQTLRDSYNALTTLAPDLMAALGLQDIDLATEEGRKLLVNGFREIYNMILNGELTPELLGAFTDKNQLIDAILSTKDAMNALDKEILKITTDFPRAMDIIYYEQKFGKYGLTGPTETTASGAFIDTGVPGTKTRTDPGGGGWVVHGGITINSYGDETGEDLIDKIERAADRKRARGGSVFISDREIERESAF